MILLCGKMAGLEMEGRNFKNGRFVKVEGKMGDYEAPSGWEEVEMNEANVTQLQTRSNYTNKVTQMLNDNCGTALNKVNLFQKRSNKYHLTNVTQLQTRSTSDNYDRVAILQTTA